MKASHETARVASIPSPRSDSGTRDRVLLVDDEPQVLVALEDLLSEDFFVLKTESPETALRIVDSEQNIAVVVTDQRMPKMSGDELLARLASSSEAARILVTGYADLNAVIRAVNDGKIFAYVTKPWSPEDLRLKVHKAAEHFRLAKELAHERQLLSRILDSMDDGVVALDAQGNVLAFNPRVQEILGVGPHEMIPKSWLKTCGIYLPDQKTPLPPEQDPLAHARAGRAVRDIEIYVRNPTVQGLEVSVSTTPLRHNGSAALGGIVVFRDVTEQRRLERRLNQAQKMEAVGQLAGGVAHDFNNLLAVITGYGELLLQKFEEGDPNHEDLTQLLAASQRAASLTRQLLAFSRRQVVQPRLLDLNEIVENVEKMLRRIIGEDIDLKTALAPDLGTVRADPGQIEQVIVNLAVNARDAMPNGGMLTIETGNATLDADYPELPNPVKPGEYVMLAISDTGTGMSPDVRKRAFEPFYTTKEPGKGTGLGLATVYGIVQQCEGQIWLYSELGHGTVFKVYLPRAAHVASQTPPPRRTVAPQQVSGTILLVEDDDAVRGVTARILRGKGYTVYDAATAEAARSLCEAHGPRIDLLLADVVMPGTSGPKLAEELVGLRPNLRVLYMSGYSGAAIARHGGLAEGAGYVEKPFSSSALVTKVQEALGTESEPR